MAIEHGSKFGNLTVIEELVKYQSKENVKYKCVCDCGKIIIAYGYNLKNGHTKSCGCIKGKLRASQLKIETGRAAKNLLYRRYQDRAALKGIAFDIEFDLFIELTSSKCYYCGIDPQQVVISKGNNGDYLYNGLDRIDSTEGYTLSNVVPACFTCNRAKGALTHQEFILWVRRVHNHIIGELNAGTI